MLRRYRSLKKIVYAATILFATIILYAGTSSNGWTLCGGLGENFGIVFGAWKKNLLLKFENYRTIQNQNRLHHTEPYSSASITDYHQDHSGEWVLPIVARHTLHVDAALQEPLHRLPLGPFEDHPLPIVVETLQMQIPTFEDDTSEDIGPPSNVGPSSHNDLTQKPIAPAPTVVHPPHPPAPVVTNPPAAVIPPLQAIAAAPEIPQAVANPPAPVIPPVPVDSPVAVIPSGQVFPPANIITPAPSNHLVSLVGNPSPDVIGDIPAPATPKPQSPPAAPAAPPPPQPPALNPVTKALPDVNKTITEMAHRLNHTRYQCEKFKVPYQVDSEVYQLPQYNLSYCKIPKAGCTYWEQVISFLNKPPYELSYLGIKMPFQISKFDIRYTSHFNLPRRDFKKEQDMAEIMKSTRVLFVRHPLERLWSCYLEKFYLIDLWTTTGIAMKTAGADVKCPKSITFREFIDFTLPLFNENWAPMTELCNPCEFQPHIIGRVETLREDSYYTLKKINLDWIFKEHDKFSREENQMLDMAIYNYQIHSIHWYSFYHKCLSKKELAAKLWDVFKKVGYLSSHAILPDNLPNYNQTTIINELKTQFRKFPLGPVNGRAQQLKMMKRDFESLPKPIMAKILERYAMDFQLFGYSTQFPSA